jgi:hypothetical protein
LKTFRKQSVGCIPCEVAPQTRRHLAYHIFTFEKNKLKVVAHFLQQTCKNRMRQNVGKEKQKSPMSNL